jgi:hypothetical protein
MNQAQKYLAQANRQIAELTVQIAHQRAIAKQMLETGQRSERAESLLCARSKPSHFRETPDIFAQFAADL